MATVLIPTPLRRFTANSSKITIEGQVVSEVIRNIVNTYPDIQKYLLESSGSVRQFINIFLDEEDIRSLNNEDTEVRENSVISIVPAIAGGNFSGRDDERK